jgi:hypothetical protein
MCLISVEMASGGEGMFVCLHYAVPRLRHLSHEIGYRHRTLGFNMDGGDSHNGDGIIVEDCRDIFRGEFVGGIADQKASLANGTVSENNTPVMGNRSGSARKSTNGPRCFIEVDARQRVQEGMSLLYHGAHAQQGDTLQQAATKIATSRRPFTGCRRDTGFRRCRK